MVEVALKRPPEPEPDDPEPPADLAADEQWRTLGTLLEELKNSKIENAKPGRPFLSLDAALHSKQSRGHKERKPTLNYQFSHHEVTMMRLALGVALRQFEDCRDGEAPQMLAYINQPSWSEASQAARTMIERLSVPGVVVMINAPPELRLD
jgi:hypothetical protein